MIFVSLADGLVLIWHQDICNHQDDIAHSIYISSPQCNAVLPLTTYMGTQSQDADKASLCAEWELTLYVLNLFYNTYTNIFAIVILCRHWDGAGSWNQSSWKTRTHLSHIVNHHYSDVIMRALASQITCVSIVCSIVCWCTDQRNHQSSVSLAFVRGIHRWLVVPLTKGQ